MKYLKTNPSPKLTPFIKKYWEIGSIDKLEHLERVIPNGLASLSFYLSDLPEILSNKRTKFSHSNVSGLQSDFFDIKINGKILLFTVSLTPLGLFFLLKFNTQLLTNNLIPLKYFCKDYSEIENKLFEANSFIERVKYIESYFEKRILSNFSEYDLLKMNQTITLFNYQTNIEKIAEEVFISERQFNRKFTKQIGISPKKFQSIVRFQNCILSKQNNKQQSMTELAHESCYYDQSHMNKEFKKFSGLTPKEFFYVCEPFSDYYCL
jgi:AraC-like DNA-binding protein